MVGKPLTVLIYIAIGLLIAFWPILLHCLLRDRGQMHPVSGKSFALPPAWQKIRFIAFSYSWIPAAIVGLLIGCTLPWWRTTYSDISLTEGAVYIAIVSTALALLSGQLQRATPGQRPTGWRWAILILAAVISIVLGFSTGAISQPQVLVVAWHHWSAFIGPSELMLSGARIFHDFPAQYGFGVTSLIAASCNGNCWLSFYYIVAASTTMFALAVLYIVWAANVRSLAAFCVLLAIVLVVCFFWNAYPPLVSSPGEVPSVGGLRFLPAIALVAGLIWVDRSSATAAHWATFGHIAFGVGALWSPEFLFFAGYVWAPYFIWRRCTEAAPGRILAAVTRATIQLAAVMIVILVGFLAIYWFLYGIFPSVSAYLAYMLYPPGELPIDPKGPVWFTIGAIALGMISTTQLLFSKSDDTDLRKNILVLLLGYATLLYCMGRSHSNNFLNIAPFSVLILANVMVSRLPLFLRGISAGMLVSLLGWLSIFGWSAWIATIEANRVLEFEPRKLVASLSYARPDTAEIVKQNFNVKTAVDDFSEISAAISRIKTVSTEPVSVMDGNYLLRPTALPEVWSAFHVPGNYYFMPSAWRRTFLKNTRDRLRQSGWLIVRLNMPAEWVDDVLSAYDMTEEIEFGTYRALHLQPRS